MDANCKVVVLQRAVVFDCTRYSADDPLPCFESENDYLLKDLLVLFVVVAYSLVANWEDITHDVLLLALVEVYPKEL